MFKRFEIVDIAQDERTRCVSVMLRIKVSDYLVAISPVFEAQGGIAGQRPPLTTKVSQNIRNRMVADLSKGAIFPPIVTGLLLDADFPPIGNKADYDTLLRNDSQGATLSIIDGMQRTTALIDAVKNNPAINDKYLRVESWIAKSVDSLIYRMLVLNTGQIPWTLKRQMEVVFRRDIEALKEQISDLSLYRDDDAERRKKSGEYQANHFLELFMAFGMRHENVNIQDQLIDEFAKLDFIEASSTDRMSPHFIEVTKLMVRFDKVFETYISTSEISGRFQKGVDVFNAQPARIGFVVAAAQYIMGKLGNDIPVEEQDKRASEILTKAQELLAKLAADQSQIGLFLDLGTLNEMLPKKTSRLGEHDRKFFTAAFEELIKSNFALPSLTQCWRNAQRA